MLPDLLNFVSRIFNKKSLIMSCLIKGCTIESDSERMLCCWLCHGVCHFKCSGLSAIVAEAVTKYKGLHWCCQDCRQIGVSFYRFFNGTKNHFMEIQNEVSELSERISAYGKLFEDFKSLDTLKSPPESSPKRRKSSRKNKDKNDDAASSASTPVNSSTTSAKNLSSTKPSNTPVSSLTPSLKNLPINTTTTTPLNNPVISTNKTVAPVNHTKISTSIPPTNIIEIIPNPDDIVPRELRVIPPPKSIFISRLASETTVEDIKYYINTNLNSQVEILTCKFSYTQTRSITSFKITVSPEVYDKLIDPCFWPINTLVREYIYKENNRNRNAARLPSRDFTNQKN